ncbi:MAG: tRNA 2-selenouridine(34) synthase MnmH [Bacteroidia bacterium]
MSVVPLLDVRSPLEYKQGHVPGALSFPLFSDEERVRIGTLYKHKGKENAVLEGLRMVGPKLVGFVEQAHEIAPDRRVAMYCWRGGMRSGSMAWLLRTAGFSVDVLNGGYKAYRQKVQQAFCEDIPFVVLSAPTGSGKTEILCELRNLGEQVLDLEQLACHRGSAFGALGMYEQPNIEQFENEVHRVLKSYDYSRRIWVEDESRKIGKVVLHAGIWDNLNRAPLVLLDSTLEDRVRRLVEEYGVYGTDALHESLQKIGKRLGGLSLRDAQAALDEGNLALVAEISLKYYDKAYHFSREKRNRTVAETIETKGMSAAEVANMACRLKILYGTK